MKGNAGNKGAVGVRLSLGGASFCFLNVHLASGQASSHERLQQMQLVLQQAFQTGLTNYPTVLRHDFAFIAGDFNFRLHASHQHVVEQLHGSDISSLLSYDQFYICKKHHIPPFAAFREPPITFRPTYKYKRNSQFYDLKRTPAWCDRIIFGGFLVPPPASITDCNTPDCPVRSLSYTHHQRYFSSDHKPVSGVFDVFIPFSKLQGGPSSRRRQWHDAPAADYSPRGAFLPPPSPAASAAAAPSAFDATRGAEESGNGDWEDEEWVQERNAAAAALQEPPIQILESDSNLLEGEAAEGALRSQQQKAELLHADEANLLSLPASPRQVDSAASSLSAFHAASQEAEEKQKSAHTPEALDELDALICALHVQPQKQQEAAADFAFLNPPQQQQQQRQQQQQQQHAERYEDIPDLLS
ncbi:hypothetical protein Efla_007140 [Eimeria flavescens]